MSLLGQVFNRALSKNIAVYLSESGTGFKRLAGAISQDLKETALTDVKTSFEGGKVFKDDDMREMERLVITNMPHSSPGDPNPHYTLHGEREDGTKVKGGHISLDPSKQTASPRIASRDQQLTSYHSKPAKRVQWGIYLRQITILDVARNVANAPSPFSTFDFPLHMSVQGHPSLGAC